MNIFKKSVIMVNVREMAAHFFTENFKLDRRISTWLQKSYVWEQLTKSMNRTPTIEEVSKKTEIPEEDIIYALDAIATPMSLFEPVYQDGNDPLFLMDQICDKKNKEDTWIEHLSLQEAMNQHR